MFEQERLRKDGDVQDDCQYGRNMAAGISIGSKVVVVAILSGFHPDKRLAVIIWLNSVFLSQECRSKEDVYDEAKINGDILAFRSCSKESELIWKLTHDLKCIHSSVIMAGADQHRCMDEFGAKPLAGKEGTGPLPLSQLGSQLGTANLDCRKLFNPLNIPRLAENGS